MAARAQQYKLKTGVPIDVQLGRVFQNSGDYGPYLRIQANIREQGEPDYVTRSIIGNLDLLAQLLQLGFVELEEELNDDDLRWVKTLKDGSSDVFRMLQTLTENAKGKAYKETRLTHFWDEGNEAWVEAPALSAPPEEVPVTSGPPAGPQASAPAAASATPTPPPAAPAPASAAHPAAPVAPPVAAPGKPAAPTVGQLGQLYCECVMAAQTAWELSGVDFTTDHVQSGAATLFIQASKNGVTVQVDGQYTSKLKAYVEDQGFIGLPF